MGLICFLSCTAMISYSQKVIQIGVNTVHIRGESIYSGMVSTKFNSRNYWIELYLENTKDSMIITQLEKSSEESECYFGSKHSFKKSDIDKSTITVEKHDDVIFDPVGMFRINLHSTGKKNLILSDIYYTNEVLSFTVADILIVAKNEEEAKKIAKSIQKK